MTTVPRPTRPARALAAAVLTSALLAGCTNTAAPTNTPTGGTPAAPEHGMTLTATLDSPTDITLRWSGRDPGAVGHIVEFATERQGPYTILQFVPPARTQYRHPDLMPTTPFYYRLRPYYGPSTETVGIALPEGGFSEKDQQKDHAWAEPRKLPGRGPTRPAHSVRDRSGAAAPTGLRATVMHANGVRLTWQDNARDEEGHLIEVRLAGAADFHVAAVLDPDIEAAGLITLPQEKKSVIRVRAFWYGRQSGIVHRTTGPDASG